MHDKAVCTKHPEMVGKEVDQPGTHIFRGGGGEKVFLDAYGIRGGERRAATPPLRFIRSLYVYLSVCFIRSHDAPALMYTRMPSHNHKQRLPQPYLRSALPLVLVIPILVLVI